MSGLGPTPLLRRSLSCWEFRVHRKLARIHSFDDGLICQQPLRPRRSFDPRGVSIRLRRWARADRGRQGSAKGRRYEVMISATNQTSPGASGSPSPRLESLDALRGFDMMWIVGADAMGRAFANLKGGVVTLFLAKELDHAEWAGFHFYDLIFPLFVFMLGVAIPFSLDRLVAKEGRPAALRRILRRGLLMFVLGLFYYGGMAEGFAHIRLMGVLQRLAICYVGASLFYLYLKPKSLAAVGAGLLILYWALMTFVPVPGFGAGDFAKGHNLANWIDAHYLPL